LERRLKNAGVGPSTEGALQALSTIRLVNFKVGPGSARNGVSVGSPRARQILQAVGIMEMKLPTPRKVRR
jgi:hypothetical protein